MKEIHSDINIIGGGLIGAITAYSLSKIGLKITILEKKPYYNKNTHTDHRTVAISEGTKKFLEKVLLWNKIKTYCEPIKKIKVIDRKFTSQLEFDNLRRDSNLGYIVKNKHLLEAVYLELRNNKNIKIFNDVNIVDFQTSKDHIITNLKNFKIFSDLNIAADGKHSFVKKFYKTTSYLKNYNSNALVLTFTHTKDHNGYAYEFFYKNGPLAILPMKNSNRNFCSSMVWTNKKQFMNELKSSDNKSLSEILNKETRKSVGEIKKIISKQIFPITAHINSRFYEKRTIYIGDSAHSFHPIAGQGWNLGMKDIANLCKLVNEYNSLGINVGDTFFCRKYHDNNFFNAYRLYQITDKLDSLFKINNSIFSFGRSYGINLINKNKRFKNMLSDFAMGIN